MKHKHGIPGTGKFMKLWKLRSTGKYPICGHYSETASYGNVCTTPSAIEKWKISLKAMGKELAKRHTHPGLTKLLLTILLEWKTWTQRMALRFMDDDLK
jgi:hypothetical protein